MMTELSLSQMAQAYGGTLMYPDCHFQSVSTDSRNIDDGQLFVALRGDRFDAHEFLPQVATRASGMVVERPAKDINVPQWVVPNTTEALGQIARTNREIFGGPLIAITGSCGKTSVKEMTATILAEAVSGKAVAGKNAVLATKGNLNNQIGVPLTLMGLSPQHEYAVVEMGASAVGEIDYLCDIAQPDVVLVNNVSPAHVAGFGSVENIAKAKGEIYQGVSAQGVAVFNLDEPYVKQWQAFTRARSLTFSMQDPQADFSVKELDVDKSGCYAFLLITPAGEAAIKLALRGEHNVANALAAAACAYAAGADLGAIATGLNQLKPVPGRLNVERLPSGETLIDDTYNANPGSVKAAINALMNIQGQRILVLGDMGELGDDEARMHAEVGRYAADKGVDVLLAVGPLCLNAVREFGDGAEHFEDKQQLAERLQSLISSEAVALFKGSRFMAMEEVVRLIKESGEQ